VTELDNPFNPLVAQQPETENLNCPECGALQKSKGGLAVHRSKAHGVVSQEPQAIERRKKQAAQRKAAKARKAAVVKSSAAVEAAPNPQIVRVHLTELFHTEDDRIILIGDDGELWGARRLRF